MVTRWLASDTDPFEASVGLLSLLCGLSMGQIADLRMDELDVAERRIVIADRELPVFLDPKVMAVIQTYLETREILTGGADCDYVFISRVSYRYNRPVAQTHLWHCLEPAKTNLRALRATCLTEIALTGNIKLLQAMGLSLDGTRPYLRIVEEIAAARQLGQ